MMSPNHLVDYRSITRTPAIGDTIDVCGYPWSLVDIKPYVNRQGEPSAILYWRSEEGDVRTSGLRSKWFNKLPRD